MDLAAFVMVDVYDVCMMIYFKIISIIYTLYYYKSPLVVTYAYLECLSTKNKKEITNEVANGNKWKFDSDNYNVYIYYKHLPTMKNYAIVYNNKNPVHFPPYAYEVYNARVRPLNKILNIFIDNEDCTNVLKMFAGPKENFYGDIHETNLSWITKIDYEISPVVKKFNSTLVEKIIDPITMKEV